MDAGAPAPGVPHRSGMGTKRASFFFAVRLPTTGTAEGSSIGGSEAAATTATAATATPATTATTTPAATAAATTAVANHLGETGVNLLLGLRENGDQVASLLRVCEEEEWLDILWNQANGRVFDTITYFQW